VRLEKDAPMAQAAAPRVRPRPRPRPRAGSTGVGIRWDRVGRLGLLAVLGIILILYISPVLHWIEQSRTASHERSQVNSLQAEHDMLQARLHQLRRPDAVQREARKLGMVAPGEKPYVVQGIPAR
jgi:cell division protein FtsB